MSFKTDVIAKTSENEYFRQVIFTGDKSQLVVMHIEVGSEIGEETHGHVEQILFNHSGQGKVILDGIESEFKEGDVVVVTPGTKHNFVNTGDTPLKIYTIYVPANHIDGRIHKTKADAEADIEDEEFGSRVE